MKIAVIGGGAGGITAAIYAKRTNKTNIVTVFERSSRILKKLLATGNGRCNLSNSDISEKNYFSHCPDCIGAILSAFTPAEERQFFESIGILFCEENGRIYPYSRRANSVSDALRLECEHLGVKIVTDAFVDKITRKNNGFLVMGEFFDKVIISAGGMSAPSFGTDGNGFSLLRSLGHTITPYSYALAPVKTKENLKQLKGIRAHCSISLVRDKKVLALENGELQFTDYGLSGIAVMQFSRLVSKDDTITVDLLPHISLPDLTSLMTARKKALSHLRAEDFLSGILHKTLALHILSRASVLPSSPVSSLTDKDIYNLSDKMKALSFTALSVLGKEQSQATSGGALLSEFDTKTLQSKICPSLYAVGEVLDCVGDCGGYNLHWAWATGKIAGTSACYGE